MHPSIIRITDDFWNIRGSFRVGGLLDVGTQTSLVRLAGGGYVFLDAYTLPAAVERAVNEVTRDGKDVTAIINLHPFHTVHVERLHGAYPNARLYGTDRHRERLPGLPWQALTTDHPKLHAKFADDFEFSVPRGVDFISGNEHVHFSSVLAFHRDSRTIHVDDTLNHMKLTAPLGIRLWEETRFHPTLARALEKRAGAAADFRDWAEALIERWGDADNLCAAHNATLTAADNEGDPISVRLEKALERVAGTLAAHRRRHG